MTFEELYSAARTAELERDTHNSRHLGELHRLEAADLGNTGRQDRPRQAFARLRRRGATNG